MKKGISIIETLIYVAILSFVLVFAINGILSIGNLVNGMKDVRYRNSGIVESFDRMEREIKNAGAVDAGGSVLGTSPGRLALDTGVSFYLSGTNLVLKETPTSVAEAVAPTNAKFSQLIFRRIITPVSEGVRIEATVNGENYTTTVVTRAKY